MEPTNVSIGCDVKIHDDVVRDTRGFRHDGSTWVLLCVILVALLTTFPTEGTAQTTFVLEVAGAGGFVGTRAPAVIQKPLFRVDAMDVVTLRADSTVCHAPRRRQTACRDTALTVASSTRPGGGDSYRRSLEGRYKCVAKRTHTLFYPLLEDSCGQEESRE